MLQERMATYLVAQYGDACNLFDGPEPPHKLEVLQRWCVEVGRPYEEIEKTVTIQLPVALDDGKGAVSPEDAFVRLARLADLGVDQVLVMVREPIELETIDLFGARIIPEASWLVPRGRERLASAIA